MVFIKDGDIVDFEDVFGEAFSTYADNIIINDDIEPISDIDIVKELLYRYSIEVDDEWLMCVEEFLKEDGTEIDFTE